MKQENRKLLDYVKANRKGSREDELSNENGWKSKSKIHKSKKTYNRNNFRVKK